MLNKGKTPSPFIQQNSHQKILKTFKNKQTTQFLQAHSQDLNTDRNKVFSLHLALFETKLFIFICG